MESSNEKPKSLKFYLIKTSKIYRWKDGLEQVINKVSKKIEDKSNAFKYKYIISEQTEEVWKDVLNLLKEEFSDVESSKLDLLFGLLLLSSYYKTNIHYTGKKIKDPLIISQYSFYMKYASGAYGWPLYFLGKGFGKEQFKGIASGTVNSDRTDLECLLKHTGLTKDDILIACWTSDLFNPGHYVAYLHSSQEIIIAIRGTFHIHDALIDLNGMNEPFLDGYAHSGMLQTAKKKMLAIIPILEDALQKYPNYKIKILGHSLGAGTAALLTILLVQERPQWNILGYCYAPPSVISKNISMKYTEKIISIVYNNDIVPRCSLGSLEALKNTIIQILEQSDNNLQRMFLIINAGNNLGEDLSKKISSFLDVKADLDFSKVFYAMFMFKEN